MKKKTRTQGKPIKKVLIANRGEIAIRIIRACKEMGIDTVAVFSEVDREALHVRYAKEAYCIGPPPSSESYLVIDKIIQTARDAGADAIHPGYGFLAENGDFAEQCEKKGVIFIGPPSKAIKAMGSKTTARQIMEKARVPIVPGTTTPLTSEKDVMKTAKKIGFPIMLKAAGGGGGKGIRIIRKAGEIKEAYRLASSEAKSAFGDDSLYVEKYIERPRHIEIQVLADHHGRVIHLGERECSIQRRHQKVIEECPSCIVDEDMRQEMGEVAKRAAAAAGYTNAGTVEFLVDPDRNFYFLEMNTRLQVEHPVTEMVTGIDIVKAQLRIAMGRPLAYRQEQIQMKGSAIECRIYAEDPDNNFLPSPGRIRWLIDPGGPGIRNETGVAEKGEVSIYYDPLISKLVAWGADRKEAIERMRRALKEYKIYGIKTTLPFHERVMRNPHFISGDFDTHFIDNVFSAENGTRERPLREIAIVTAAIAAYRETRSPRSSSGDEKIGSKWKLANRLMFLNSRL
jgi:acetyl-CoA carboxylase biotin carboxylase subunit